MNRMLSVLNMNKGLKKNVELEKRNGRITSYNVCYTKLLRGKPPFTWEESASDALALRGLRGDTDWSLAGTLYQLEGYNGWGYRLYHQHVLSPYLWSYSNHYQSGK